MQPKIKLTNPFAGAKDRNQVWKELMEKSKPRTPKAEVYQQISLERTHGKVETH